MQLPQRVVEALHVLQRDRAGLLADQLGRAAPGEQAIAGEVEGTLVLAIQERDQRGDDVVLVDQLELLVYAVEQRHEGVVLERADDVVVDARPEDDGGPDDRHHGIRVLEGPELRDPVRIRLVLRVGEVGGAPHRPVLGDRLGVVGEGAVGRGR